MYFDAALEQHYQQHPEDRPSLTEVAWAYAQQQRFDVTEDDIRRAVEDAEAAGLNPTPREVALWALASTQGPVPA